MREGCYPAEGKVTDLEEGKRSMGLAEEDVIRLQISVHDSMSMAVSQSLQELVHHNLDIFYADVGRLVLLAALEGKGRSLELLEELLQVEVIVRVHQARPFILHLGMLYFYHIRMV